jgi:hypothetical protein
MSRSPLLRYGICQVPVVAAHSYSRYDCAVMLRPKGESKQSSDLNEDLEVGATARKRDPSSTVNRLL